MANRYWVGGAGNWSSTTKWSASSGGASGASVPTSVDDAIFDANSGGKFTATVDTAQSVNSITITPSAAVGIQQIALSARLTTNNLTTTGTAGNNRIWFRGNTYGIAQDFVVNGTVSISDCDFRDIYVIGSAAPISGTRIGDLRGIRGITASTPKTVYWNSAAGGTWSATNWAATSGGATSDNNFPLAQDTAVIENTGLNTSATVTLNATLPFIGTIDMSTRTNAATIAISSGNVVYGNWVTGSGITYSGALVVTFSGRNIQTITSAGKTFSGGITVDSYGGTVQLADALNIGTNALTVNNGTFSTQNYNVTAGSLSSSNSNVRTINLGSSTVTLGGQNPLSLATTSNLTFNAGTSTLSLAYTSTGQVITFGSGNNPGNVSWNNVTFVAPSTAGLQVINISSNQTINGTLTVAGATAVRRIFLRSDVLGTQRDLTVGTLVANDCDFRDIEILGAAIGTAPTRAGDCGGNAGITFPSPKTVYWNLGGTAAWTDTGWATSSGGSPAVSNFPLAQDTAVFDNTGVAVTVVMVSGLNMGSVSMSSRTSAMTLNMNASNVYGNWTFGVGVTTSSTTLTPIFSGRGTQTITSNGVTFGCPITIDCVSGTVQLADALTLNSARTLTLTSGTFDAVTYNVTTGLFSTSGSAPKTLKMGSGTWTLSGTGTVWSLSSGVTFYKGTANIILSDTSASARTFSSNSYSYNKITIGGTTGTSTTTFNASDTFTEIASTKTVAHTIALGGVSPTYGAWTVTGTAGNVVTVTGTATITIAGARVSGVDYLALGTTVISATSPGEFYAGVNSTGGTNAILTAAPTPVTRYWVGGTGTWDATTTTKWSASSGGAGGFSVPTSADAVVFDMLSNATAYTVTCTATQLRCGSLTMSGPLTGNVTWAGTAPLAIHDNVTLPATGLTRSYTGTITLSGSTTGKTLTTNGMPLASTTTVNGVGCGWSLGSALNIGTVSNLNVVNGAFDTQGFSVTALGLVSDQPHYRTISFGASTLTFSSTTPVTFGTTETNRASLVFDAGISRIVVSGANPSFAGYGKTFYDVDFTSTSAGTLTFSGTNANTFNNLSVAGITSAGLKVISLSANQTINGTLTLSAGTNATMRTFVQSDTIGTTRTLTCAAFSGTEADFRDITIAGAAAPVSGTRLGDCKGNSGITFPAAKTVYWNLAAGGNWSATGWATTGGGTPADNNFPLAQDTAVFQSTGLNSAATVTVNAAYNIGTIDMSARTSNTMTLAVGTQQPTIYGNWINGTGTTLTGTGTLTFAGRGSQTITSASRTFTQVFTINSPSGSVTLQDALTANYSAGNALNISAGTFDANNFNVTLAGPVTSSGGVRTIAVGSGTWVLSSSGGAWSMGVSPSPLITGTGVISLTSASAKTFSGTSLSYSGITLNQGGAGTLTITGNNTFANISNTYKATGATAINMGTTTQTVGNFTASGEAGRVLTVQGSSASSPATLVLTGGTVTTPDYLAVTGVRAYSLVDTWYAGANSTNNGSLGWYFSAGIIIVSGYLGNFFAFF